MASAKALDIYKKLALKTKQASGPRPGQAALPQLRAAPPSGPSAGPITRPASATDTLCVP